MVFFSTFPFWIEWVFFFQFNFNWFPEWAFRFYYLNSWNCCRSVFKLVQLLYSSTMATRNIKSLQQALLVLSECNNVIKLDANDSHACLICLISIQSHWSNYVCLQQTDSDSSSQQPSNTFMSPVRQTEKPLEITAMITALIVCVWKDVKNKFKTHSVLADRVIPKRK